MRLSTPVQLVVLAVLLIASGAFVGAQQAPGTFSPSTPLMQQGQTVDAVQFPPPTGSDLLQHVTDASFVVTATPATDTAIQDERFQVTMLGDMQFRTGGYQVSTETRILERDPAEIQFFVDISTPSGPTTQVLTPETVQEQVTVSPGTYDTSVTVTVDGQTVYRQQDQLQLDGVHAQQNGQQDNLPQEEEQALEENASGQTGASQDMQVQQRIQQLEQRIFALEQELQRLRQASSSDGAGQAGQQSLQRDGTDRSTGQQTLPQSPGDTRVQSRDGGARDAAPVTSTQDASSNASVSIQTQPLSEEEQALEEREPRRGQDSGPLRILISIFR